MVLNEISRVLFNVGPVVTTHEDESEAGEELHSTARPQSDNRAGPSQMLVVEHGGVGDKHYLGVIQSDSRGEVDLIAVEREVIVGTCAKKFETDHQTSTMRVLARHVCPVATS